MELKTFESEMDSVIAARGRDYFRAGRIGTIEEIAPGLFHAAVDGTTLYDVDVRMRGECVVSAACSCPYDRGPYCKHIAGVLVKMRDARYSKQNKRDAASEGDPGGFPHETYDRVLAYLVKKYAEAEPKGTHGRAAKRPKRNKAPMALAEAVAEIESGLLDFYQIWDGDYRHGSHYSYEDNGIAMRGLNIVVDNIEACDDSSQACLLCVMALGYVIDFVGSWDDSFGIAGDTMERLESLLGERCEELALEQSTMLKLQVAHALVAAAENPAYGGWGTQASFLTYAADLVERRDDVRFALNAVTRFEQTASYGADKLTAAHYRLLCKLGDKKALKSFEKANALHPIFFIEKLEAAFLGHDMETTRQLLIEKTGWGEHSANSKRRRSFTDWGLPSDVFPNGYYTYLEAVFEELQDRDSLLALYRRDVDNGRIGAETLEKLRCLAGDQWPGERDKIIEEAISSGRRSSVAEKLIQEDGLAGAALRYCQAEYKSPGYGYGYSTYSQERILRFYCLVGKAYPDETRAMLLELIERKSKRASGRDVYREICGIIQRIQSLFGTEEACGVVNALRERYPRRRNLMEELDALEATW